MEKKKPSIDYRSAGVNIDAGNEAVDRIKGLVAKTHTTSVLSGIGGFGSLFDIKSALTGYDQPVMVQGIDGVGTKIIIARKMKKFNTIGIDLVSACTNDIITAGARPMTFLDYIASDRLDPGIIEEIVSGIAEGCIDAGIALVGGETAEMPDTYLRNEHDLVGIVTGFVERQKMITGSRIKQGDLLIGIPSSGLHTNGYSLARKLFFEVGGYEVADTIPGLERTVGEALLAPHVNYTNHVFKLLDNSIDIKGLAHITGGGLTENIPRILPEGCSVEILRSTWEIPAVFKIMQELGNVKNAEMFRTFNMGIGMVVVIDPEHLEKSIDLLSELCEPVRIGSVIMGQQQVIYGS